MKTLKIALIPFISSFAWNSIANQYIIELNGTIIDPGPVDSVAIGDPYTASLLLYDPPTIPLYPYFSDIVISEVSFQSSGLNLSGHGGGIDVMYPDPSLSKPEVYIFNIENFGGELEFNGFELIHPYIELARHWDLPPTIYPHSFEDTLYAIEDNFYEFYYADFSMAFEDAFSIKYLDASIDSFSVSAVPEEPTLILLGMGLIGVVCARRWHRRRV